MLVRGYYLYVVKILRVSVTRRAMLVGGSAGPPMPDWANGRDQTKGSYPSIAYCEWEKGIYIPPRPSRGSTRDASPSGKPDWDR